MTERLAILRNIVPSRTRPLLVTALVVGDPFLSATRSYMNAVIEGGADVVELVMPFSDPAYHGPVMRRACERSLSDRVDWDELGEMIADFRKSEAEVPVVVTSYYNRVLAGGVQSCVDALAEAGADGLMVMDLGAEESGELKKKLEFRDLSLIQAVAPTTTVDRFRRITRDATGFLVWTGHCGTDVAMSMEKFVARVRELRQYTNIPLVASMNVESGEDAMDVVRAAHGALVGSSLAWLIEGGGRDVEERLRSFVADLRIHLDAAVEP